MENTPFVSVLMTAYNREKYIAEAIESVLASTYTNFELIIVDDCSNDRTVEIARSYEAKDKRIKVYENETNLGDYPNRNKAAGYAKGEYLKYLDSDDIIYPSAIEKCILTMSKFPESGFGLEFKKNILNSEMLMPTVSIYNHFFISAFLVIGPGGTIIKRELFIKLGGYPTKYGPANDMYFNLKISSATNIVLLSYDMIYYRLHAGQEINNKVSYLFNNYRYLNDALLEIELYLSKKQKTYLFLKNKRRFIINIFKYFLCTFNIKKTISIIKNAGFNFADFLHGIFHYITKKNVIKIIL